MPMVLPPSISVLGSSSSSPAWLEEAEAVEEGAGEEEEDEEDMVDAPPPLPPPPPPATDSTPNVVVAVRVETVPAPPQADALTVGGDGELSGKLRKAF